MSTNLSGRDICDICKDAERKWASKCIRKEVSSISPDISVYREATTNRLVQMKDANVRMDFDVASPYVVVKAAMTHMHLLLSEENEFCSIYFISTTI